MIADMAIDESDSSGSEEEDSASEGGEDITPIELKAQASKQSGRVNLSGAISNPLEDLDEEYKDQESFFLNAN